MNKVLVPGEDTKEEITGPLVDYLRSKDTHFLRAYIVHYAYDRRDQSHQHNPWVLSWYAVGEHQVPAKMPLWVIEQWDAKRPLAWTVVPPAQGNLF